MHQRQAETEAVIEPDSVTDDRGRKSIAVVVGCLAGHPSTLPATLVSSSRRIQFEHHGLVHGRRQLDPSEVPQTA